MLLLRRLGLQIALEAQQETGEVVVVLVEIGAQAADHADGDAQFSGRGQFVKEVMQGAVECYGFVAAVAAAGLDEPQQRAQRLDRPPCIVNRTGVILAIGQRAAQPGGFSQDDRRQIDRRQIVHACHRCAPPWSTSPRVSQRGRSKHVPEAEHNGVTVWGAQVRGSLGHASIASRNMRQPRRDDQCEDHQPGQHRKSGIEPDLEPEMGAHAAGHSAGLG